MCFFTNCMVISQLLMLSAKSNRAALCLPCDKSKCEEPKNCTGAVVAGVCGCCSVCAKQKNEICGGVYGLHGTCDRGLQCVIRPPMKGDSTTHYQAGVCEEESLNCSEAHCLVQPMPLCPKDSVLTEGSTLPWVCCPQPRHCACRPGCRRRPCPPGHLRVLVPRGLCCSCYECQPVPRVNCSMVKCPPVQQVRCPDSFKSDMCLTADGCCTLPSRCECLSELCGHLRCTTGSSPHIVSHGDGTPGNCCHVYECVNLMKPVCASNNTDNSDGELFQMDACWFCQCQGWMPVCFSAQCGRRRCWCYYVPEGECSPVCEEASNLSVAPPICGAMENCPLTEKDCPFGLQLDNYGCLVCRCKTREEACAGLTAGCPLVCSFGFQMGPRGCEGCLYKLPPRRCRPLPCSKECPFGFLRNKDGCGLYHCKKCPEVTCDEPCPAALQQDARGCSICQCSDTSSVASVASSAETGPCRSVDGRRHGDGESWHDGCRACYCNHGREMCTLISCPVPVCDSPAFQPGQCCPSCQEELHGSTLPPKASGLQVCLDSGGEYFAEGKTWSLDPCTQCTCLRGLLLCEAKVCPPLLCLRPIRSQGACCAQCPPDPFTPHPPSNKSVPGYCLTEEGDIFLVAQSWKPNTCSSCVCTDGGVRCFSESCPLVGCAKPVLHKGQCCPYCLEDRVPTAVCHFNGVVYADEERWDPDSCTHCYCQQGQTLCSTVSCPALPCREPALAQGSCCPVCSEVTPPSNSSGVKTARHGNSWIHQPSLLTRGEKDIVDQFRGNFGSLQLWGFTMPATGENSAFHSVAWVTLPILIMLIIIAALLVITQKRQWIHMPFYSIPEQDNQLVYTDCLRSSTSQGGGLHPTLQSTHPVSSCEGYYSVQQQDNLQGDSFYQTV